MKFLRQSKPQRSGTRVVARMIALAAATLAPTVSSAYVVQAWGQQTPPGDTVVDLHSNDGIYVAAVSGDRFSASAQLSDGALRAAARAGQDAPLDAEYAGASALIEDVLTFTGFTGDIEVEFRSLLRGTIKPEGFGGGCVSYGLSARGESLISSTFCETVDQSYADVQVRKLMVNDNDATIAIVSSLLVQAYGGAGSNPGSVDVDFGSTAYLSVIVPAGVTVTSGSGQFLTEQIDIPVPQPVPLPGTLSLAFAPLLWTVWRFRRALPASA